MSDDLSPVQAAEPEWYDEVTKIDPAWLEGVSRRICEHLGQDPERLIYRGRLRADGSPALLCPAMPTWQFFAGQTAWVIDGYTAVQAENNTEG